MMRFKQLKLEQSALQCSSGRRALVDMSMGLNSADKTLRGEIANYSCKMMIDDASGNLTSEKANELPIDDLL